MHNFKSVGRDCQISPHARFYGVERIEIGDNVRIDDFCILSAGEGGIKIGSNIHIGCHTTLIGAGRIEFEDYSGSSGHCSIYSSTDDFSGNFLVGPTIDKALTNVRHAPVTLKKYSIICTHTVVMPGVTIGEGAVIGAQSLVKKSVEEYAIWAGNPLRFVRLRKKGVKEIVENGQLPVNMVHMDGIDWDVDISEPYYGGRGT